MGYHAKPNKPDKYLSGYYKLINESKYVADPKQIVYRSSLELKFCNFLDKNPNVIKWGSEIIGVPYIGSDNKQHTYYLDFYVEMKNPSNPAGYDRLLVEVKPSVEVDRVIKNEPPKTEDTLVHWLKKNPKNNKSTAYIKEVPESKKAILHYKIKKALDNYFLLEVNLETGRHHQIRTQLSSIGCSIKGDLKYGFDRSNKDASISLHARQIQFVHPVSNENIDIIAPLPKDAIWDACL